MRDNDFFFINPLLARSLFLLICFVVIKITINMNSSEKINFESSFYILNIFVVNVDVLAMSRTKKRPSKNSKKIDWIASKSTHIVVFIMLFEIKTVFFSNINIYRFVWGSDSKLNVSIESIIQKKKNNNNQQQRGETQ